MRFKSLVILVVLFFCFYSLKAQRANTWYFGANAGLNFNTTPPTALTNGQTNGPDNTSTMSDACGNLLFYTNGTTVWNRLHAVMPNGSGLIGNISAGQCALIVPMPSDPDKYVIFHVNEFATPGYLNYTVVDMSLSGGLGNVVSTQKNVSLGTGWTEKLCAYYNSVNNSYWVVTHKWNSNQFVAFNLNNTSLSSATAIASSSVVSSIGSAVNCGTYGAVHDAMGQLTISPDGTKIINALTCQNKFELFNFNSVTGAISNSVSISTSGNAWGTAFSPNSKVIYVNSLFAQSVFQYDINIYSQPTIIASQYAVVTVTTGGYNFGYMELGPDNKLYITKPGASAISVVNNPNVIGAGCNFSIAGQSLGTRTSNHGLSRIAYNIPSNGVGTFSISASPNATIGCLPQTITLTANAPVSSPTYTWSGPGIIGTSNTSTVQVNAPGIYTCSLPGCSSAVVSATISIHNATVAPSISISPSSATLCSGTVITATANGASAYTWQPGGITTNTASLNPSVSSVYLITGVNGFGCQSTQTLSIVVYSVPAISMVPLSPTVCFGSGVTFTPSGGTSYSIQPFGLSGNDPIQFVISSLTGNTPYTLTGVSSDGCVASVSGIVSVSPPPTLTLSPSTNTVCSGSSVSFTATGASTYTWYPGSSIGSVFNPSAPLSNTIYTLIATSAIGCTATAVKSLTVIPLPTVGAQTNPTTTCAGGNATLTANGATTYTWFPGAVPGQTINVNPLTTTIYTVNGETNGCVGTASVVVANALSPTLSSSGNLDCNNTTAQISIAANSTTYAILWSGPSVTGATSSVVTVNTAGIYSVVITDTISNCSATETITITNSIGQLTLDIIPSNTLACFPGPPINMLVSASAYYSWFPATEVTPSTGPIVSVSPSVTSTYSVFATLGVCSGSAVITISVNLTPTLSLMSNSISVCSGSNAVLSASGAITYSWEPWNQSGPSITVSPVSSTIYTLTGMNNICTSSNELTVTVLPTPALSTSVSSKLICAGDTVTLSVNGAPDVEWTSAGFTSTLNTIVITPFASSGFTVVGTNSLGCSAIQTVMIKVGSGSPILAASSASLICNDETVTLTVNGASSYTWLPINQTGTSVVSSPTVSMMYTVTANNLVGCKSYTTVFVNVQECIRTVFGVTNATEKPAYYKGDLFKISFTVTAANSSPKDLVNVILNDNLKNTFTYPCTYTLFEASRIISQDSKLTINSMFNGDSELSLTVPSTSTLLPFKRDTIVLNLLVDPHGFSGSLKNFVEGFANYNSRILSDSSNNGFSWDPDSDGNPMNNNEMTPVEIEVADLFIPEGFSPDDDGKNDFFVISGLNDRRVNITIFNRWGNKVYQKENYDNTWNGKANTGAFLFGNNALPEATYYYVLEFPDKERKAIAGFIVLRN